jgi:nitrogen-specific signal transduction histidine kinase
LKRTEERVRALKLKFAPAAAAAGELDSVLQALNSKSEQLRLLGEELGRLKSLLSERLKRPQHLEDKVSLLKVIEQSISELCQQNSKLYETVVFTYLCDIRIVFNHDITITVIQNLIRNAVEELGESPKLKRQILIALGFDVIGDVRFNNLSRAATLSVITLVEERQQAADIAKAIRSGLEGVTSTKAFGSGVGMDITKLVFRDLLGAQIEVLEDQRSAGIKITFKTDPMNAELVFE